MSSKTNEKWPCVTFTWYLGARNLQDLVQWYLVIAAVSDRQNQNHLRQTWRFRSKVSLALLHCRSLDRKKQWFHGSMESDGKQDIGCATEMWFQLVLTLQIQICARKARLTSAQRHAKRSAEYWERNGALEYAKD